MSTTITIERLEARYRMPRGELNPAAIQSRLDRTVLEDIGTRWADLLAPVVPEDDEGVLVINRLDVKLLLGLSVLADVDMRELWGRGLRTAFGRALSTPPDGHWLAWFPTRAAYLASFLTEVLHGAGAARWCFTPFRDLDNLPRPSVIREALLRERPHIVPTLALLAGQGELPTLVALLAPADAAAIMDAIESSPHESASATDSLLTTALRDDTSGVWAEASPLVQLDLVARVASLTDSESPSRATLQAIEKLAVVLPAVARLGPSTQPVALLQTLRRAGDEAASAAAAFLLANHPSLLSEALHRNAAGVPAGEVRGATRFGGIFLLLPALAELDLDSVYANAWLSSDDATRAAALGRWLALLKCLQPSSRRTAHYDPALAIAAGLPATPSAADLRWLGKTIASLIEPVRTTLATRLEKRVLPGDSIVIERVKHAGMPLALTRDSHSGLWLRIAPDTGAEHVEALTGLPNAKRDLAFLETKGLLRSRVADLFFSQVAADALNLFARRLPGFGLSSAEYLSRNFLHGVSTYEVDGAGLTAQLPEAPMRVALRIAGFAGATDIDWLPGCRLHLENGGEG